MARTKGALGKKTTKAAEKVDPQDVMAKAKTVSKIPTFEINGVEFLDISDEQYRTYVFADGRELVIYDPRGINISASGGHRIVTKDGWSLYVKPKEGWYLHWRTYPGTEHFNF